MPLPPAAFCTTGANAISSGTCDTPARVAQHTAIGSVRPLAALGRERTDTARAS